MKKPPKWLRDIASTLRIRSQFIVYGNNRDHVLADENNLGCSVIDAIWIMLRERGYAGMLVWDPVAGLSTHPESFSFQDIGESDLADCQVSARDLRSLIGRLATPRGGNQRPFALVMNYAARMPSAMESEIFMAAEKAANEARLVVREDAPGEALFNPIFWIVSRSNDVPFWLASDNHRIKSIPVPLPSSDERHRWAAICYDGSRMLEAAGADAPDTKTFSSRLARLTHGMTLRSIDDIVTLAGNNDIPPQDIDEAVELYKVGDVAKEENPWRNERLFEEIGNGEKTISKAIKGQEQAANRVLDILKRTAVGLTGAQAGASAGRPRGVLFFAGPTGVGKTEMAKTIAKIVFGDPEAYLRFDMSEFKGDHSGDRLIGAPPGYVGFDQGGELTNAMRERPFRVLLFDEIEKANPKILDKFLQILEDGRLTDGRGETVYFSEALIIFTSNAGISEKNDMTQEVRRLVTRADMQDPEEYEKKVMDGVRMYFEMKLQRPELHNRLGENVVVFNYITPEVAAEILKKMQQSIIDRAAEEAQIRLDITDVAHTQLADFCSEDSVLDNGGRGIGSKVEAALVNPLARYVFDHRLQETSITITGFSFDEKAGVYKIDAMHSP